MSYFYLQIDGEADQLVIDTNARTLSLPGQSRQFSLIPMFHDGGIISGMGSFIPGIISFSVVYKKGTGSIAFNSARYALTKWLGVPKFKTLYFYIVDNDGNILRQRCYPVGSGNENYSTFGISDTIEFRFQLEKPYFENTTASTTNYTATSNGIEPFTIINNGQLETPPLFTFTPTGALASLTIQLTEGYGFELTSSFGAGEPITYDCKDSSITVNGEIVTGIQTDGSTFNMPPGTNVLYITAGAGALVTSINERYL